MVSPHFSYSSFSFLAICYMSSWSCANNTWSSAKLSEYTYVFWIGRPIVWHFLFQLLNTRSRYILNWVNDKQQPCLNLLVTLKPFVIRFPIFIFELDPLYNDFIYSINLVVIIFIVVPCILMTQIPFYQQMHSLLNIENVTIYIKIS